MEIARRSFARDIVEVYFRPGRAHQNGASGVQIKILHQLFADLLVVSVILSLDKRASELFDKRRKVRQRITLVNHIESRFCQKSEIAGIPDKEEIFILVETDPLDIGLSGFNDPAHRVVMLAGDCVVIQPVALPAKLHEGVTVFLRLDNIDAKVLEPRRVDLLSDFIVDDTLAGKLDRRAQNHCRTLLSYSVDVGVCFCLLLDIDQLCPTWVIDGLRLAQSHHIIVNVESSAFSLRNNQRVGSRGHRLAADIALLNDFFIFSFICHCSYRLVERTRSPII